MNKFVIIGANEDGFIIDKRSHPLSSAATELLTAHATKLRQLMIADYPHALLVVHWDEGATAAVCTIIDADNYGEFVKVSLPFPRLVGGHPPIKL